MQKIKIDVTDDLVKEINQNLYNENKELKKEIYGLKKKIEKMKEKTGLYTRNKEIIENIKASAESLVELLSDADFIDLAKWESA